MKIVLVSSTITYIPDNYDELLLEILRENNISNIILIKINRWKLLKNIILLFLAGAWRLAGILFLNLIRDILKIKERKLKKSGVKILKVKGINDKKVLDFIEENKIGLLFNLRSRSIFKKEILNIDGLKILNLHHGILPENRGVFSDLRNLAFGGELGFSIHEVNEKIDDGKILVIKKIEYKKNKKYLEYLKFSTKIEEKFLSDFIKNIILENKVRKNNEIKKQKNKEIIFYKNLSWKEIKEIKKTGLKI